MSHPLTDITIFQAISIHVKSLGHEMTVFHRGTYDEIDDAPRLAFCKNCGRRLALRGSNYDNDALNSPCEVNGERVRESRAWLTGAAPRLLLDRLTEATKKLPPHLRPFFDPGHFDAGGECLDSEDGQWRLRWYLRKQPEDPISEDNPQHPAGIVELQQLVRPENIYQAHYIGPYLNRNIGTDERYWLVRPLESNTEGIAYCDEDEQWRFRRTEGVVGHYVPFEHLQLFPDEKQKRALERGTQSEVKDESSNFIEGLVDPMLEEEYL